MALTTNLVSYWKLDESSGNAADSVGANTLTNNNTVSYASAIINNGADFTSANTNKSLRNNTNLGIDGGNITMGGWFYFYDQVGLIAMQTQSATSKIAYSLKMEGGGVKANRNKVGTAENQTTAYTLSNSTWYHIIMTYDGTDVILYVNGAERYRVASSGNGGSTTQNATTIGCDVNTGSGSDQFFGNQKTDEVGVWSRALSQLEVAELYNKGVGLAYPLTEPSNTMDLGLCSYYKLDESSGNATDALGVNTLTNTGTATYSAGKVNNGVNFSATTMYLGKANPTGLPVGSQPFSFGGWVKFTNFSAARYFIGFGESANNKIVSIRCDSSTSWYIDDNGVGTAFPAISAMLVDTWYHIIYTYPGSGNIYTAYLNGVSIGTANNTRAPNLGTTVMGLGSRGNTSAAENLVGSLDEVGFWNRALTADEILQIANSGRGNAYPFTATPSLYGAVSYYKLDESSGNAADSVGSDTGTNFGTVTYSAGKINNGATFTRATPNYFTATGPGSISAGSLSMWVKGDFSSDTTDYGVFSTSAWSTNGNAFVYFRRRDSESKTTRMAWNTFGDSAEVYTTTNINTATFYHCVWTWDTPTKTIKMYINGALDSTTVLGTMVSPVFTTIRIGGGILTTRDFNGQLDEVGVWTRALGSTEVTSLYNAGAGKAYPWTASSSINSGFLMFM